MPGVRSTAAVRPRKRRTPATSDAAPDDRFFRHLVGSMRNGVIAIHRSGTVALVNDEAYRVFGLARQPGDVGRPFSEAFRDRPDLVRVLGSAFELTTLPNRAELRLRELDRVIGYTLSQVRDDEGLPIGAVLFFKDLTQVEQFEERERLRDRLASLGEMAAGIAHELKNPLAGIEVMAGLLRRQVPDSPDAQSLLADIIGEAKLANAIVVEMLEFVRPLRLQVEPVDIAGVLQQALGTAQSTVPKQDVVVRTRLGENLPRIDGDANQLCQVFTNLLINALEALDRGGHIDIRARPESIDRDPGFTATTDAPVASIVVEVEDDGPGVPADLQDRIFNPFFTTKTTGSGLGLPIVRKIVDAHDGRIDLSSVPGRGTRFRVTLPVASKSNWFK